MAEQSDLRHVRRAQPRHAALALDRFDHRGLFAADVGAGAAPQMDRRQRARRIFLQRGDLALEYRAAARVLVAQVNIDLGNLRRPRRDHHAFEKAVRIALEVIAVLERSRLALVDIDGHQARRAFAAQNAPLAAGRKTRAAEPAQAGGFHRFQDVFGIALARQTFSGDFVAAVFAILVEADVARDRAARIFRRDLRLDSLHRRARDRILADHHRRRLFAASDARRRNHAHVRSERCPQRLRAAAARRRVRTTVNRRRAP